MKSVLKFAKTVFYPHWLIIIVLVLISAYALFYSFTDSTAIPLIQYASYTLSFYTLVVVMLTVPTIYKDIRSGLNSNEFTHRFISDKEFRVRCTLLLGFIINVIFSLLKLMAGLYYHSVWIGAIGIYYMVISVMRFGLLIREYYNIKGKFIENQRLRDLKRYRLIGYFMFLLNTVISGLVIQMLWNNESFSYPGFLIFANAAYAFYSFGTAIVNVFKYRKMEKPVLSAAKMLSFACALTSILSMQTAMLSQFSEVGQESFVLLMNTLTGTAVCVIIFGMAIWMIRKANKEIKMGEIKDVQ